MLVVVASAAIVDRRELPPPYRRVRPHYINFPQKSLEWKAARCDFPASEVGAWLGLSPYKDDDPEHRYAYAHGDVENPFNGNLHCEYGIWAEPRDRGIVRAVFKPMRVTEYGMFRDAELPHSSDSPDGRTSSVRIAGARADGRRFEWTLGKCMVEIKGSRDHYRALPCIPHLMQLTKQMHTLGSHYGLLSYYHRDKVRIWLVRYSHELWTWMLRRMELANQHVKRHVPITRANPYFNWFRWPGVREWFKGSTVADYLADEWFSRSQRTGKPMRKRITLEHWNDQLRSLGLTDAQWRSGYTYVRSSDCATVECYASELDALRPTLDTAELSSLARMVPFGEESAPRIHTDMRTGARTCHDVGQLATPPRPELYLVYEYERPVPWQEINFLDDAYLTDVDEANSAWFEANFPGVAQWSTVQKEQLEQGIFDDGGDAATGDSTIERLFIDTIEDAPEHDEPEPEPYDCVANDPPALKRRFNERLEYFRKRQALEDAKAEAQREQEEREKRPAPAKQSVLTQLKKSKRCAPPPPRPLAAVPAVIVEAPTKPHKLWDAD